MEAEKAAANSAGVKAVALDIDVGVSPYHKRSDSEIAKAVIKALQQHTLIPDDNLKIRLRMALLHWKVK